MPRYFYKINLSLTLDKENEKEARKEMDRVLTNILEITPHIYSGSIDEVK